MHRPVRLLTGVPICDGHDSAITTINAEFVRHGIEVVYLGFHRSATDIARAAVQEGVAAAGISSYNGGHVEFFREVRREMDRRGGRGIGLFGGGGGTILEADARIMRRQGTDEVFFAGTALPAVIRFVQEKYGKPRRELSASHPDSRLSARLTAAGEKPARPSKPKRKPPGTPVIGFTGPGGAGKTTLIDEIALRFLHSRAHGRMAILSHDPGMPGGGALLGDRAMMINSQHDRVFMRSMSTRGVAGGLAPGSERCLEVLLGGGFDMVLVETVGTGQEAMPFPGGLFDRKILVLTPDYGAPLQLRKVVMLEQADIVVLNKSDQPRAQAARTEIGLRLEANRRGQSLLATAANVHRDPGVDKLFELVAQAGL